MLLVPNTGTSTHSTGDETESDLDVEWSGAIAKGATIVFVYTGCTSGNCSTTQFGAFDALVYAIDTKTAPIISSSYGTCEPNLTLSSIATFNAVFQQANAQGQTIISASGDSGAADCDNSASTPLAAATHGLAVDFPAVTPVCDRHWRHRIQRRLRFLLEFSGQWQQDRSRQLRQELHSGDRLGCPANHLRRSGHQWLLRRRRRQEHLLRETILANRKRRAG